MLQWGLFASTREETSESDDATVKEPAADHHILYLERGFTEQIVWYVKSTVIFLEPWWLIVAIGPPAAAMCWPGLPTVSKYLQKWDAI